MDTPTPTQSTLPSPPADASAGGAAPVRRIFIVEDEKVVADNLEEQLKDMGYSIAARASSGEEAVEQVAKVRPDLVLMDIYLHGRMDGVEAAKIIYGRYKIPVVYLTGHSDRLTRARIQVMSSFGFVVKPFEEGALRIVIEIALYRGSFEEKLKQYNHDLHAALAKTKPPEGLLPICAWCKKVRDEQGAWQQFEEYAKSHLNAMVTHSICPDCTTAISSLPTPG